MLLVRIGHAVSVILMEDTDNYLKIKNCSNVLSTKHCLMCLRPKIITLQGSFLSWFSGCWLHSPGGSCGRKEAGTYQSRKARAQLHDGHSTDKKSKLPPLYLQGEY